MERRHRIAGGERRMETKRPPWRDGMVRRFLAILERRRLRRRMAECAAAMHDEIMSLEEDFRPLEEELHRKT
jgi:hypothetical protein